MLRGPVHRVCATLKEVLDSLREAMSYGTSLIALHVGSITCEISSDSASINELGLVVSSQCSLLA